MVAIRPERREVVVGTAEELERPPGRPGGAQLAGRAAGAGRRLRGADPLSRPAGRATVIGADGGSLDLALDTPVRAIAPGQSGVLYTDDGRVLGGGVIA